MKRKREIAGKFVALFQVPGEQPHFSIFGDLVDAERWLERHGIHLPDLLETGEVYYENGRGTHTLIEQLPEGLNEASVRHAVGLLAQSLARSIGSHPVIRPAAITYFPREPVREGSTFPAVRARWVGFVEDELQHFERTKELRFRPTMQEAKEMSILLRTQKHVRRGEYPSSADTLVREGPRRPYPGLYGTEMSRGEYPRFEDVVAGTAPDLRTRGHRYPQIELVGGEQVYATLVRAFFRQYPHMRAMITPQEAAVVGG